MRTKEERAANLRLFRQTYKKKESKAYYLKHKEEIRVQRHNQKILVLTYYSQGTPRCARCGIEDTIVLTVDHINGHGNEHRRSIKRWGGAFYPWLINQNYPEGYQVLCHNCNARKRFLEDNR